MARKPPHRHPRIQRPPTTLTIVTFAISKFSGVATQRLPRAQASGEPRSGIRSTLASQNRIPPQNPHQPQDQTPWIQNQNHHRQPHPPRISDRIKQPPRPPQKQSPNHPHRRNTPKPVQLPAPTHMQPPPNTRNINIKPHNHTPTRQQYYRRPSHRITTQNRPRYPHRPQTTAHHHHNKRHHRHQHDHRQNNPHHPHPRRSPLSFHRTITHLHLVSRKSSHPLTLHYPRITQSKSNTVQKISVRPLCLCDSVVFNRTAKGGAPSTPPHHQERPLRAPPCSLCLRVDVPL